MRVAAVADGGVARRERALTAARYGATKRAAARRILSTAGSGAEVAPPTERCVMAKGQVNKGNSNKPKLTAKQKQAKRAEKRAAKNK